MMNIELSPEALNDLEILREYLVTHKNYAFYRLEGKSVKIIRILDTRRDVIYTLFGIKVVDDYNEYWDEE